MSDSPAGTGGRLSQIGGNAMSLLTTDVLNKLTTFVIYATISRFLGTREFGQLSLGLMLFYTGQVLTTAGLPALMTREVAKRRSRSVRYFINGSVAAAMSSLVATSGMIAFAWAMQYDADTRFVICLLSLGLAPFGLATVTEAVFRGWEEMHWIAVANVPINIAKVIGAVLLLRTGFGVISIALLLVGCRVGILLIESALFFWRASLFRSTFVPARVDVRFIKRLLFKSSTFLGVDGIIAVWTSVNTVLLSKFFGEVEAGLYAAAHQLLQPALLVYQSAVGSVFPAMCKRVVQVDQDLTPLIRWIIDLLMLVGLPVAIALYFMADTGLALLYGDPSFVAAAGVVRLLVVVLLLRAITNAFGHALWAESREATTLRIVAVNLGVNLVIGFLLIPQFGLLGAGWTSLITWLVNAIQHYTACHRMIAKPPIGPDLWKLLAAAALMVLCVLSLRDYSVSFGVLLGSGVYAGLSACVLVNSYGGLSGFRTAFFAPLLKS